MTTRTQEQKAADRAALAGIAEAHGEEGLREWAYDSHKDFTGMKGRWAVHAPIGEVLDWLAQHFTEDASGTWVNTVPFEGEA